MFLKQIKKKFRAKAQEIGKNRNYLEEISAIIEIEFRSNLDIFRYVGFVLYSESI